MSASLLNPQGLAADKAGNVYVADTNNNIVRILAQGCSFPETSTGNHSQPQNLWFIITNAVTLTTAPSGDFPISGLNSCNGAISAPGPGVVKTCQVVLHFLPTLPGQRTAPLTMTDSSVSPAKVYRFGLNGIGQSAEAIFVPGTIKTLAASLAQPSAIAIDSAGDVYYAESGTGAISGAARRLRNADIAHSSGRPHQDADSTGARCCGQSLYRRFHRELHLYLRRERQPEHSGKWTRHSGGARR